MAFNKSRAKHGRANGERIIAGMAAAIDKIKAAKLREKL